jgi:hypothetical protein
MGINQSDVAMRDLLSQIDNLDAKKKRLRIAQNCQYGREMAEYYEVFDTMKRDMLKQSLIVAKIKEQQCEAHLQIMREYRRAEEQLQSTQPPPVNQHTEWATVATQAIRTIGELGKELLTSRATKQIEKQRAATEQRADEARKATDEKPARRAAAEQTTTTVAAVQGAAVTAPFRPHLHPPPPSVRWMPSKHFVRKWIDSSAGPVVSLRHPCQSSRRPKARSTPKPRRAQRR